MSKESIKKIVNNFLKYCEAEASDALTGETVIYFENIYHNIPPAAAEIVHKIKWHDYEKNDLEFKTMLCNELHKYNETISAQIYDFFGINKPFQKICSNPEKLFGMEGPLVKAAKSHSPQ
ncbi:MAG: hypothetical protein EP298_00325 [Gammaproteobacteria bacterium]|nr:MAG: hypothetical protein EP298_00325 [Gammaproteobacteria bacterium]UTW42040.1 hypothetical protein KFE69_11095 [bacterium SCSIO 12844]